MSKNNDILDEIDCIKQKKRQVKAEYPDITWDSPGAIINRKTPPPEVQDEYERLCTRLEELGKEDDKAVGL